ncbi:hypothetical protein PIB30_016268 [Stylosanthes scabra]|uniref:RST domain-containing protein n=1 Tax=Stylosanthes scabra TaxID=79078 RepID=A0ABU6Z6T7_9FABA|nr:hypothetical protein [Stylosanthes scabra]
MNIDHQESLLELKNRILMNMGELGRKQISQVAYRLHVAIGPQASNTRAFWLKSDQHVQLMFGYHDSNPELRCIELYVKVEDLVISSASAKANPQVVQSEKIGRGAKRAHSPVISSTFAISNRLENAEANDANLASEDVSLGKLCLPPKTRDIGGASRGFALPTSMKPSIVDTDLHLGLRPPLKMQKVAGGKGKAVETGVLAPEREEASLHSKNFQAQGMCDYLEPAIASKSQKVLEDQVMDLEIRLVSKENERAALEDLKITLISKVKDLENQLKEAEKTKKELDKVNSCLVKVKKTAVASDGRVKQLKAEFKHLRRSLTKAKDATHRNIKEQVRPPVLSKGRNNTFSQPMLQLPTPSHENQPEVQNPPLPQHVASPAVNSPHLPQHVGSQNVNNLPLLQQVASQIVSNPALSQKQSQDEGHQPQPVQDSLQNSQKVEIQNLGKDPVLNNEVAITHNPDSKSRYAKLQQTSNQQAKVNEQPGGQTNGQKALLYAIRICKLLPFWIPQLPKDKAMQLHTLVSKLEKDEIAKDSFGPLMRDIVGVQLLRSTLSKICGQIGPNQGYRGQQHPVGMPTVGLGARQLNGPYASTQLHQRSMNAAADQSQMTSSAVKTMENNARKSQELDVRMETQGLQPSQLPSSNSDR